MSTPRPPSSAAYLNRLFSNHQAHDRRDQTSFCRLATAGFLLMVILGCFVFILVWIFLHPRLPQVYIASAALSPLSSAANNTISATCNLTLLLTNTNLRLSIIYDHFEITFLYQSHQPILSQTLNSPIMQPKKSHAFLEAKFNTSNENVGYDAVNYLISDFQQGSITFDVRVYALARFSGGGLKVQTHVVRADCDGVRFGFSPSFRQGILLNPYKQCHVYL